MGIGPAFAREMARFTAGVTSIQTIRNLLRSIEIIVFILSVLIGMAIWCDSGWLDTSWLRFDKLFTSLVEEALSMAAAVVALRFSEGIYRSAFIGLQKQVVFNIANALLVTLRHAGVLGILAFFSPTIEAFFMAGFQFAPDSSRFVRYHLLYIS